MRFLFAILVCLFVATCSAQAGYMPTFPTVYQTNISMVTQMANMPAPVKGLTSSYWQVNKQQQRFSVENQANDFAYRTVDDYVQQAVMNMYYESCICSCPTQDDNVCDGDVTTLCGYDQVNEANYLGQTTINGVTVDHFNWQEGIPKMAYHLVDFYNIPGQPIPIQEHRAMYFENSWIGNVTMTWQDWQPNVVNPIVFAGANNNYCPGNCQSCQDPTKKVNQKQRVLINFMKKQVPTFNPKLNF